MGTSSAAIAGDVVRPHARSCGWAHPLIVRRPRSLVARPFATATAMLACLALLMPGQVLAAKPHRDGTAAADPVLVGAGDIADCATTADSATADLLDGIAGTVFTLGDNAYPDGSAADFSDCYAPTWGRHLSRTRPATGNHDYITADASAYFDYFGSVAGARGRGWYSYDLGSWHIVVLNSNCEAIGGCGPGSPQVTWLEADLAAHAGAPLLAYWHHPRFSSGAHGGTSSVQTFWDVLYGAGAELVLNGHDHDYERFAPQDPGARPDRAYGIREFVVGTGGAGLRPLGTTAPNSEVLSATHGVLRLTLRADGYDWRFVPVAGATWTDSGSSGIHGSPPSRIFQARADATVDQTRPSVALGLSRHLITDRDTADGRQRRAYVRFKVTGVVGHVWRATLRLWVTNATVDGPSVRPTSTAWSEATLTWRHRPAPTGPVVADAGALRAGTWAEFDVTSLVPGNGTYGFILRPTSSDGLGASSRQGGHPPQLRVESSP